VRAYCSFFITVVGFLTHAVFFPCSSWSIKYDGSLSLTLIKRCFLVHLYFKFLHLHIIYFKFLHTQPVQLQCQQDTLCLGISVWLGLSRLETAEGRRACDLAGTKLSHLLWRIWGTGLCFFGKDREFAGDL